VILVAGSANVDFVVRANHIPRPGETVLGQSFQTFAGGKGANQAVACSKAGGASTQLLTALGADAHASVIETSVNAAAVELLPVRVAKVSTGAAFICVSDDGENAITVAPGANAYLLPQHLPDFIATGNSARHHHRLRPSGKKARGTDRLERGPCPSFARRASADDRYFDRQRG
jgi:sugar/nucleoside kinase (ribokinase family)